MKRHNKQAQAPNSRHAAPMQSRTPAEPEFFSSQILQADRFFLDLNPPPSENLVVICGGGEHCQPDYHMKRSDFAYYSIEFVARGEGVLLLDGKRHELVPGAVFAYGPGIAQDIRCNPQKPLVKYFVDFVGRRARQLLAPPGPRPGQIVQTSAPEDLLHLFDELTRAGLRSSRFSPQICAAITEQLLLRICETAVTLGAIGSLAFETYQHCRQYTELHFLKLKGLADMADQCHIDPAYLCRLYGRFDNQTPYQHLMRLKMQFAAQRLQSAGMLAKQVARELGFVDPFQFSRTFRRVMGVSPRQFMNVHRPQPPSPSELAI